MSSQAILPGLRNAISSPVSAPGAMPCDAPAGRMCAPSGPVPALASLSARQAAEKGLLTSGIFGQRSSISSASATLTQFLASRLQARTALLGSTLYTLTWKERVTPSGRLIPALRASVRRILDSDCTGWLTPAARDWKDTPGMALERMDGRSRLDQLPRQATLAGWATPTACDGNGGKRPHPGTTLSGRHPSGRKVNMGLASQVHIGFMNTEPARLTAYGKLLTGFSAGMAAGGQLNPAHSRWLMGLPAEWDACAGMATPLSRRRPRRS